MFDLEEYAGGFHDGYLNKYTDLPGPTLDFYISDSLQDMLDIDIRSEVANVVGSVNECEQFLDISSSLEHGADSLPLLNNNICNNTNKESNTSWNTCSTFGFGSSNSSSSWFGANSDFLADVGACVNPISVMPIISSSLIHMSPKTNLNANNLRTNSPPLPSPNVNDIKSHLTFSPAHIKISANSIRNEQITSHIPKQIVPISSAVTSGTTAPATLATNCVLQRKNSAVDAIRKDLGADLRKVLPMASPNDNVIYKTATTISSYNHGSSSTSSSKTTVPTFLANSTTALQNSSNNNSSNKCSSNGNNINNNISSSTIKLGPGIGGLTFANNITYNKLKHQTNQKSSTSASTSTPIALNGTLVSKRDRESSPMQTMTNHNNNTCNSAQHVPKILSRNSMQSSSFTPKSIASSAHHTSYALQQQNISNVSSTLPHGTNGNANNINIQANNPVSSSPGVFNTNVLSNVSSSNSSAVANTTSILVKPLQQKIKPIVIESEFPKPAYSYSCLIAMALKNSRRGSLPVSEIYSFMCEHFPYFKTAPSGWKNSVRHNLSLNKCFEKIEKPPTNGNQRKGCLWAMNPDRIAKMDEEVQKWSRKDPMAIRNAMVCPDNLEALERGEMKHGSSGDSDVEMDSQSEIEEASDIEEQELDETVVDNMLVEEDIDEEMNNDLSIHSGDGDEDIDSCDADNKKYALSSPLTLPTKTATRSLPATHVPANIRRGLDIEFEDIYDAIDIDDDKEAVRMAMSQSDIIELSPADYKITGESHQSPKRARLNVNCPLSSTGESQQQIQIQSIKKIVKVQNIHDLQQIQQQLQQQQQIVVQSITTNGGSVQQTLQQAGSSHYPHINRKMQLVNRFS